MTDTLMQSMAQCQAMIELLATHRLIALEIFHIIPKESLERFEECLLVVSKYIEQVEK